MPPAHAPSPAERTRSVLARAEGAAVTWLDAAGPPAVSCRSVTLDGPDPAPSERRPVVIEIADAAPLPCRERIRARVRLQGQGTLLDNGVLALSPHQVELREADSRTFVSPTELRSAGPDLLATREGGFLSHLASAHAELLQVLVRLIDRQLLEGAHRAVPLALDRCGLVMRLEYRRGHADVRLAFEAPATTLEGVRSGLRRLAERAHAAPHRAGGATRHRDLRARRLAELLRAGPAAARICRPEV